MGSERTKPGRDGHYCLCDCNLFGGVVLFYMILCCILRDLMLYCVVWRSTHTSFDRFVGSTCSSSELRFERTWGSNDPSRDGTGILCLIVLFCCIVWYVMLYCVVSCCIVLSCVISCYIMFNPHKV